jgi:glutathione S-transferase
LAEKVRLLLYGNRESGHSYKVALALALLGLPYEFQAVDLATPRKARPAKFRRVAKFGEVPVLCVDDHPLVQSNGILSYLSRVTGKLAGPSEEATQEWLFWEANRIGFSLPNLRYHRCFRPGCAEELVTWFEQRTLLDLERLDRELSDGRLFLLGAPSVADISCCAYLFWADQVSLDMTRFANVRGWLERISKLPGWRSPYDLLA